MMGDWLPALAGGVCIGLAAVLLMATNGQIMGISGMLGRMLPPWPTDWSWRVFFLCGVIAAPVGYLIVTGNPLQRSMTESPLLLAVAGLLVGAGAVIGNGCTSGHGICGLSRLSSRSIVAVAVFMTTAFITVFVVRHLMVS